MGDPIGDPNGRVTYGDLFTIKKVFNLVFNVEE
jgi:hypothetical protein